MDTTRTPRVSIERVAGDDAYALLDVRAPAGTVLPPHLTSREDGALLVLEGRVEVVQGRERRRLGPGGQIALPRATPRRIAVLADARLLCLAAPAGLERLADVIAEPGIDDDDMRALLAAAGVELLPANWGAAPGESR